MKFVRVTFLALLAALVIGILPNIAEAAWSGYTTAWVNQRSGPGTNYAVRTVIPAGSPVTVFSCTGRNTWCDVDWRGRRGWVSGRYLAFGSYYAPPPTYEPYPYPYYYPAPGFFFGFDLGPEPYHHERRPRPRSKTDHDHKYDGNWNKNDRHDFRDHNCHWKNGKLVCD